MGNGGWTNDTITTLVIPTGATTGQRIVIDGTTGIITGYDANNNVVDVIEPQKIIIQAADGSQVMLRSDLGYAAMVMQPANPAVYAAGSIRSTSGNVGTGGATQISSAALNTATDLPIIIMEGADGVFVLKPTLTLQSHTGIVYIDAVDMMLGPAVMQWAQTIGNTADTNLYRVSPGNLATDGQLNYGVSGVAETWHTVTPQNLFTLGTVPLQYRRLASPPNTVQITGEIVSGATTASGTAIATLPSGYFSSKQPLAQCYNLSSGVNVWVQLANNGQLQLHGAWANGNIILINTLYSIDIN